MSLSVFAKRSVTLYTPYLLALVVLVFAAWTVWILFLTPAPAEGGLVEQVTAWLDHLAPVIVALIFWLPGVLVLAFSRHVRRGVFFFAFCQAMCVTLLSGALSELDYTWAHVLFWASMVWTGPLTFQAVLVLVAPTPPPRALLAQRIAYALAGVLTALYIAGKFIPLGMFSLFPVAIANLWLVANLCMVFAILIGAYTSGETLETRRKAGALLLSNLVGFTPFLLFALLPDTLFDHPLLPYEATYLFLAAIPGGYGYAILRYRLVRLEETIDRGAAFALVVMAVGAVYGICYLAFSRLLPNVTRLPLFVEMLLAVGLIFAVQPLYQVVQKLVNRFFYGAWYDDRAALQQISRSVSHASGDPSGVAYTLCRVLEKSIPLEYAQLLLAQGALVDGRIPEPLAQIDPTRVAAVMDRLVAGSPQEVGRVRSLEPFAALTKEEQRQVLGPKPRLWMVLRGSEYPLGLLVLGPRTGGGDFERANLETLELLARQAKMALENAALLAQVRRDADQITRLHRQLLQVREGERKGLARELHDQTIQALYGSAYHLSELKMKAPAALEDDIDDLRQEITEILSGVRRLCADLRPPSLDSLGIVPALTGLVRNARKASGLVIDFSVEGDEEQDVPEEAALALYRILQEGLANAQKHAQGAVVRVRLRLDEREACLTIADDGPGFAVPPRFDALIAAGHFGLAGIQERVDLAGGRLEIASTPATGFHLTALIPVEGSCQEDSCQMSVNSGQ